MFVEYLWYSVVFWFPFWFFLIVVWALLMVLIWGHQGLTQCSSSHLDSFESSQRPFFFQRPARARRLPARQPFTTICWMALQSPYSRIVNRESTGIRVWRHASGYQPGACVQNGSTSPRRPFSTTCVQNGSTSPICWRYEHECQIDRHHLNIQEQKHEIVENLSAETIMLLWCDKFQI